MIVVITSVQNKILLKLEFESSDLGLTAAYKSVCMKPEDINSYMSYGQYWNN